MLPLLKRYSDDIRAAHLSILEKGDSTSIVTDIETTESNYCTKLIGELQVMKGRSNVSVDDNVAGAPIVATPSVDDHEDVTSATAKRNELIERFQALMEGEQIPPLDFLKELDAVDKSILDEFIIKEKEKCSAFGGIADGNLGFATTTVKAVDSPYTVWLIERGFYTGCIFKKMVHFDIEICTALLNAGVRFPCTAPEFIANYGNFNVVKWLYENVNQGWSDPENVLKAVVAEGNIDDIKYMCALRWHKREVGYWVDRLLS